VIAKIASAAALVSLALTMVVLGRYEAARAAWRPAAAAIGTSDYDATASDAAYREVSSALVWVDRSAEVSAAIVVVAAIALGRSRPRTTRSLDTRSRRVAARIIDALTIAPVLATARITTPSPGMTVAIDWLLPALVLAALVFAAANGATIGDRVAGATKA
jgi:hypothetical protein